MPYTTKNPRPSESDGRSERESGSGFSAALATKSPRAHRNKKLRSSTVNYDTPNEPLLNNGEDEPMIDTSREEVDSVQEIPANQGSSDEPVPNHRMDEPVVEGSRIDMFEIQSNPVEPFSDRGDAVSQVSLVTLQSSELGANEEEIRNLVDINELKEEIRDAQTELQNVQSMLLHESDQYDPELLEEIKNVQGLLSMNINLLMEKANRMSDVMFDLLRSRLSQTVTHSGISARMDSKTLTPRRSVSYSCKWVGKYFEIPEEVAWAAFQYGDTIVLHRRAAIDELYKQLRERRVGLIYGPPGIGKSTGMFAYALGVASEKNSTLWINTNSKTVLILGPSVINLFTLSGDSWSSVLAMIGERKFQYVFVDQCRIRKDGDRTISSLLTDLTNSVRYLGIRLFAITSDGFNDFRGSGFDVNDMVIFGPWTLEEYMVALQNPSAVQKLAKSLELDLPVAKGTLVEAAKMKFYYAGISARFFFDLTISGIEREVEFALKRISDKQALLDGNIGTGSSHAVNTLFYINDEQNEFSSFYIGHTLIDKYDLKPERFTIMTKKLGSSPNRGAVGQLFELFTHCLIRCSRWLPLDHFAGLDSPYRIPEPDIRTINIRMHSYQPNDVAYLDLNNWYIPRKATNPGFDSFFISGSYDGRGHLSYVVCLFLQVTCGKSHKFNPPTFATAASVIANKVRGFVPEKNHRPVTRSRENQDVSQEEAPTATRIFIEVIFAVPEGQSGFFILNWNDTATALRNLDDRWSAPLVKILEVPQSQVYTEPYDPRSVLE